MATEITSPVRSRAGRPRVAVLVGLVVAVALVPLLFLGPGTDLDVRVVLESGEGIVDDLDYEPSRPPGAPVHETLVGVLDRIGGIPLVNLGSLALAGVTAASLYVLCRDGGMRHPLLATGVLVANPWFLIAATSVSDFVWALGFLLAAAVAVRRDRPLLAALLAGLAIGCRAPTVVLVAAVVIAEAFEGRAGRRRATILGAGSLVVGAVLFVPAFVSAGNSLSFARNDFATPSLFVQAGRFAAKDLYLLGPLATVLLLFTVPAVIGSLRRFGDDWLVRFGAVGFVLSQVLFFRFPWKIGHLLPTLVCIAVLVGVAVGRDRRWLVALVALQLVYAVVRIQLLAPDDPNQASSAEPTFAVEWGPLVDDSLCRQRYRDEVTSPDREIRERAWKCAAPFGAEN